MPTQRLAHAPTRPAHILAFLYLFACCAETLASVTSDVYSERVRVQESIHSVGRLACLEGD